ncbi:uncharacterized protein LOC123544391 [Mercenaria mercenaria]|uniref:uncharacterized protein LOC123544391 n=1 Tax=Mercenaria mercenaria TaxID=6596 RepID=UPI00234EAA1C|nr:uncharacterized protein LOC123544391 [Mercenaria mercenaria]
MNCQIESCYEQSLRMIPAGSFAEGLYLSGSDQDFMFVVKDAVCLDQGSESEHFIVLETDYTNTPPGYTKALYTNIPGTNQHQVSTILSFGICGYKSVANYPYVSSAKFRSSCYGIHTMRPMSTKNGIESNIRTTNGPAITNTVQIGNSCFERDTVYSVYFYGSDILLKWANRRRLYNWPSVEIVKEISEMEGYIVPVGDKQSENQNLEWRICYTAAEKELVSSLSDIQIKLYVLLKLVAKSVLNPVCKALTSYVVKNVVFWIVEGTHPEQLSPDNLVSLLLKSLHFIKCCLEENHFPNYMIPERNLLRGAVVGKEKQNVINFLSDCLREGGTVMLSVPKLYKCVSYRVTNPENSVFYEKWRDEVENQRNVIMLQQLDHIDINSWLKPEHLTVTNYKISKDKRILTNKKKLFLTVVPDCVSLWLTGKSIDEISEIYKSRLQARMLL